MSFGVLLILTGVALAALATNPVYSPPTVTSVSVVRSEKPQWSISGNLTQGDKMVVEMRQGGDWPVGAFDPPANEYDPPGGGLFVYMNITDPHGNTTVFEIVFTSSQSSGRFQLVLWRINVTQEGGLNTTSLYDANEATYEGIGGVVAYSGIYNVSVVSMYPPREQPPSYLEIRKGVIIDAQTDYPYWFPFLPGGIAIGAAGTIVSAFGLKSSKHRALVKRKRNSTK